MDNDLLYLIIAALAFGLALNLKLTFSVLHTLRRERIAHAAPGPGETIPALHARAPGGGRRVPLLPGEQACVLLYLASGCPKCASTLPQLAALLPAATQAGLAIRIVSEESRWRLRRLLGRSPLASAVFRVNRHDYHALNPLRSSPSYHFVDHAGTVQATGLVGDANWQSLLDQLAGTAAAAPAAA